MTQNVEYVPLSIGPVGYPSYDAGNDRVKLLSEGIHSSAETVNRSLEDAIDLMVEHGASRLTARFVTQFPYGGNVEARIQLNNGFSGMFITYVGINLPSRRPSEREYTDEEELLGQVLSREPSPRRPLPEGYQVEFLETANLRESDIPDLVTLYRDEFPTYTAVLDEGSVRQMVQNSIVYAVRNSSGRIVSTAVAEIAKIPTERGELRICELSEMATSNGEKGKGLVTSATDRLIDEIRDRVDMIYAEARAPHLPINRSFRNLGFQYGGRLRRHCTLSGAREVEVHGPHEDLNVWYMLPHQVE